MSLQLCRAGEEGVVGLRVVGGGPAQLVSGGVSI